MLIFKPRYCIKKKCARAVIQKSFTKEDVGAKRKIEQLVNSNPKRGKGIIYT